MQDKFTVPKTREEFIKRAEPVTLAGAKAVIQALDTKIKKVAGPLVSEKEFFEEVGEYKLHDRLPERFKNE